VEARDLVSFEFEYEKLSGGGGMVGMVRGGFLGALLRLRRSVVRRGVSGVRLDMLKVGQKKRRVRLFVRTNGRVVDDGVVGEWQFRYPRLLCHNKPWRQSRMLSF
jgi:hypothetical protein